MFSAIFFIIFQQADPTKLALGSQLEAIPCSLGTPVLPRTEKASTKKRSLLVAKLEVRGLGMVISLREP